MSKKWIMLMMTLIVLLTTMPLLAACDDDDDDEEETKTVQPTPTETAQPTGTEEPTGTDGECTKEVEYRVGATSTVMGMTAESRDISEDVAMDEINEAGGIRIGDTCVKFKHTFIDDKGTTAGAVSAIQKLLYDFKADAVIYPGGIVNQAITRPYTEEEKVLGFGDQYPVADWIGEEYPYTFHLHYNTELDPFILFDWVSKNRPDIKTVHGLRNQSTSGEIVMKALEKAALPEFGIEYTGTEWHDSQARDFYPMLTSILSGDHPDAIILEYYNLIMTAKQARELGFEGTFIVTVGIPDFAFNMMTPEEMEGIISNTPSVESPLVPQYYKDYKESYKERQGSYPYSIKTFPTYLMPYYIAAAMKAAGSTDPDKLVEVMETQALTLEFPSGETLDLKLTGAEHYGINRACNLPPLISVIENGKPVVKEVIAQEALDTFLAMFMKYK